MDSVYSELVSTQHIRALTLAPSEDFDAALQCTLDQQHIGDPNREYEAISYTWGDQDRNQPLRCNGIIINITPNLASALLYLRSRTTPRRLWADAICINQANLDEKSQQIPLMARIYRSATQVRVWLGNGDEGESRALADLAAFARIAGPKGSSLARSGYQYHETETHQALVDLGRSAKQVFRMPWFGRRWIVQELVLNGNVMFHCGQSDMSWPSMHFAFHALPAAVWDDNLDIQIRRKLRQFGNLWRTWCFANVSEIDCGIYSLLNSFQDLQCKEARDRIYAIAGLADDVELKLQPSTIPGSIASVTPSYDPSVSDEEVFQDLAFQMIRSGKVFSTLAHAGASRITEAEPPLASWIPDVRHLRSWPLVAIERESEFKLVGGVEQSNGILTLRIQAYGWRSTRVSLSRFMWSAPCVEHVFEPPHDLIPPHTNGRGLLEAIDLWLRPNGALEGRNAVLENRRANWSDVAHVLWFLVRSQLLTEDGYESFDRLPSYEMWLTQYSTQNVDDQWLYYLIKALSKRTLYIGQRLEGFSSDFHHAYFFGYGPRDLAPGDAVLFPTQGFKDVKTLFLRPAGTEHKVIGDGLAWIGNPEPSMHYLKICRGEITLHLI